MVLRLPFAAALLFVACQSRPVWSEMDLPNLRAGWAYERTAGDGTLVVGTIRSADRDRSGIAKLHWREFLPSDPQVAYEVPGMDCVTAVQWIGPDRVLVAGAAGPRGDRSASIADLQLDYADHSIRLRANQDLGALRPASVVFHAAESRIYLLDAATGSILAAPWAGPSSPLPAAFRRVASGIELSRKQNELDIDEEGGVRVGARWVFCSTGFPLDELLQFSGPMRVWFDGTDWRCDGVKS